MSNQSITKQFIKYVTQNIFGMLGVSCYIIVDTFFIAKAAGADGITVLNLVLPIYSIIFAVGSMIGVGSAIRFAILRAQGERESDYYFSNAIFFVWLIGIWGTLAGIFIPDKIIALMGGDVGIVALGTGYARTFLLFTPFFMMNYVVSSFVRNDNDPGAAMVGTLAGSLSNILFDYIFMFPLKMGLTGAALATAASPILSILICSTHFLKKGNTIPFRLCIPSLRRLWQACQLGVSAFVGEISSGITTMLFNFLILGLVGNVGVAAYGVIANYALVVMAIFNGVAQGSQPLISACYGKGDTRAVTKILRLGICTAVGIAAVVFVASYTFTDPLIALFNSEKSVELAAYARSGMQLYFIGFLFAAVNVVGSGFLSATERAREAFGISVMRGFVAISICSVVLARVMGLNGVWLSFPAAELLTAMVLGTVLLSRVRLTSNVKKL